MIVLPENVAVSPPPSAVRLMPSWEKRAPMFKCDDGAEHDWKMTRGVGSLFVCARCQSTAWLNTMLVGHA